MKEDVLLSIIIPVYNVQFFLERCVNSIISQEGNFEVILVDDGSPDKSGEICDELAKKDKRIKVFHKENGGVSSARNLGIENAKGKYISFVDSDDYVSPSYFSSISGYIKHNDCDLYIFNYYREDNKKFTSLIPPIENGVHVDDEVKILKYSTWAFIAAPWNKVYKKDIILNNNLSFDISMKAGEDRYFNLIYSTYCKNYYICHETLYYYVQNGSGAVAVRKLVYLENDNKLYYKVEEIIKDYNTEDKNNIHNENCRIALFKLQLTLNYLLKNNVETKNEITEKLNSLPYIDDILKHKYKGAVYNNYYKKLKHMKKGQWTLYLFDRISFIVRKLMQPFYNACKSFKRVVKENLKKLIIKKYRKKEVKNRVLFISFSGEQYSDNPKAISDKLHELSPKTEIVWLLKEPSRFKKDCPRYIKRKKYKYKNLVKYLATSRVWVDNDKLCYEVNLLNSLKNNNHLFVETWHGDRGIKRSFYSIPGFNRHGFSLENKGICDYFVTGSTFAENMYREMFRYSGEFLKVGCPRNDKLFNIDRAKVLALKKKMGIAEDTKILVYAPTFRKRNLKAICEIDFDRILKILKEKYNCNWILLNHEHHLLAKNKNLAKTDYSTRIDMADLICVADMLITDYSSCSGDFAITEKPVYLYIDDYKEYISADDGFRFDLFESPYKTATTQEELEKLILEDNENAMKKNSRDIAEFYGSYEDGNASEKVCKVILEKLNEYKK